ncbi:MAG: intradiol ring-cleavage dioxygenase [Rhodospirillaceae bacterium]
MTTSRIRRQLLAAAAMLPLVPAGRAAPCGGVTPAQTEGPFFKSGTPERTSLVESGANGVRLVVTGRVISARDCRPVPGAVLEFWHSDERGQYDNRGYRYRGHQRTDDKGGYRLETIVPARYTGRTRHIHVKVTAHGAHLLTTQLYFPNEPANRQDGLYRPDLELVMAEGNVGRFDFVVTV